MPVYILHKKLKRGDPMLPDRLNFLNRFNAFYRVMTNAVKEEKVNERDFYLIITAKVKSMDQERREKLTYVK